MVLPTSFFSSTWICLSLLLACVSPFFPQAQAHTIPHVSDSNQESLIPDLSLPQLVQVESLSDLEKNWNLAGSAIFEEGRILLTPKPAISSNLKKETHFGSLWSNPAQLIDLDSFSIDLTFRSLGAIGQTNSGFSIWLIDSNSYAKFKTDNFGGPSKYKGLQISFDAITPSMGPVVRLFLNDGTKAINIDEDFIGAYTWEFQGSNVPSTVKIGFKKGLFKVTIDNILVLETDQIDLSSILSSQFVIGATANAPKDVVRTEQFELLILNSYSTLLDDLKTEIKQTLVPKYKPTPKISHSGPSRNSDFFHNREAKLRDSFNQKDDDGSARIPSEQLQQQHQNILSDDNSLLSTINDKLDNIRNPGQQEFSQLQKQLFDINRSIKLSLSNQQTQVSNSQRQLQQQVEELNLKYDSVSRLMAQQNELLESFNSRFASLNKYFDLQLNQNENLDSKLSKLHEQYLITAQSNQQDEFKQHVESNLSSLFYVIRIIMVPVVILLVVLALLVYRLRSDIKHSKIL